LNYLVNRGERTDHVLEQDPHRRAEEVKPQRIEDVG